MNFNKIYFLIFCFLFLFLGQNKSIAYTTDEDGRPITTTIDVDEDGNQIPPGYPKVFDGIGYIDRISKKEIIINDQLYKLSHDVTFNIPNKLNVDYEIFQPGAYVGFLKNPNGKIDSIWLKK
ncbi:MAG: hypothetical protein HQK78_08620 [Desulfobacterales bacterium]|nr:hypothetical protein [Desulfobacterales bacterium]